MKIHLTLLFLCLSLSLSSQTFLGPTIGYDFATLETQQIFREGILHQNGQFYEVTPLLIERSKKDNISGRRSLAFGFQLQKMLSKQWSLTLRGSYSKKEYIELIHHLGESVFLPEYKISYRQIGLSVLFNRKIKEKISVGVGPNISHFIKWDSPTIDFDPYRVTKRAYGLDLQLGYHLGPVYLAVDYTKMLKPVDSSGYLKGASSLMISGTYFFELRKR